MLFILIHIYNLKRIWKPLVIAAILLKTSKWKPNNLFSNALIYLFIYFNFFGFLNYVFSASVYYLAL